MWTFSRVVLPSLIAATAASLGPLGAAPNDPAPLLKAVTPPNGTIRARVAVDTTNQFTDSQIKARLQKPKAATGETIDITVALDTLPGKSAVSSKKWKSWGFEVPANRIGVIPELIIPATQLAPKASKGYDVEVKIQSIPVEIVEPPMNSDLLFGSDLYLRMSDVTKNADRAFQPRFYFGDKSFEFTAPNSAVKRPGTGDEAPAEPGVDQDATLVPVSGPMMIRGCPVLTFASINGLAQYKVADGTTQMVNVGVSSNTNWPGGILMSMGTARGCGIDLENEDLSGLGVGFATTVARGKAREFRLGFQTGPGFKSQKDLVLKDVTVYVNKTDSGHNVVLGTKFMNDNIRDAVYTCGPDGSWRLLGRMKPELLQDIKTRTPPKKP